MSLNYLNYLVCARCLCTQDKMQLINELLYSYNLKFARPI